MKKGQIVNILNVDRKGRIYLEGRAKITTILDREACRTMVTFVYLAGYPMRGFSHFRREIDPKAQNLTPEELTAYIQKLNTEQKATP